MSCLPALVVISQMSFDQPEVDDEYIGKDLDDHIEDVTTYVDSRARIEKTWKPKLEPQLLNIGMTWDEIRPVLDHLQYCDDWQDQLEHAVEDAEGFFKELNSRQRKECTVGTN
ncbi:MAG: hypothetical protein SGPRY_008072 [Prymnesium sp.]